jgi:hypothetical protein
LSRQSRSAPTRVRVSPSRASPGINTTRARWPVIPPVCGTLRSTLSVTVSPVISGGNGSLQGRADGSNWTGSREMFLRRQRSVMRSDVCCCCGECQNASAECRDARKKHRLNRAVQRMCLPKQHNHLEIKGKSCSLEDDFRTGFTYNTGYNCSLRESPMDGGSSSLNASLSLAELEAQITELAGHLNAANYRWLALIGEFDRRNGWSDGKLPSCAHGLNFKCGLNLGAARCAASRRTPSNAATPTRKRGANTRSIPSASTG